MNGEFYKVQKRSDSIFETGLYCKNRSLFALKVSQNALLFALKKWTVFRHQPCQKVCICIRLA